MTNKPQGHKNCCKSIGKDGKLTSVIHTHTGGEENAGISSPFLLAVTFLLFTLLTKASLSDGDSTRLATLPCYYLILWLQCCDILIYGSDIGYGSPHRVSSNTTYSAYTRKEREGGISIRSYLSALAIPVEVWEVLLRESLSGSTLALIGIFKWERAAGIEPAINGGEPFVLPLNYARFLFFRRPGRDLNPHMLPRQHDEPLPGDYVTRFRHRVPFLIYTTRKQNNVNSSFQITQISAAGKGFEPPSASALPIESRPRLTSSGTPPNNKKPRQGATFFAWALAFYFDKVRLSCLNENTQFTLQSTHHPRWNFSFFKTSWQIKAIKYFVSSWTRSLGASSSSNILMNFPVWKPGSINNSPAHNTSTSRTYQEDFRQIHGVVPASKGMEHWDAGKGYNELYKVFWGLKTRWLCNVFKDISQSVFMRLNPPNINDWISRNIFPNTRKQNLPDIPLGIVKQLLFRANSFGLFKPLRNRYLMGFFSGRASEPPMLDYGVNMQVIVTLGALNFHTPQTPNKPFLYIASAPEFHKAFNEVFYNVFI
jgi:hypothetical protein